MVLVRHVPKQFLHFLHKSLVLFLVPRVCKLDLGVDVVGLHVVVLFVDDVIDARAFRAVVV